MPLLLSQPLLRQWPWARIKKGHAFHLLWQTPLPGWQHSNRTVNESVLVKSDVTTCVSSRAGACLWPPRVTMDRNTRQSKEDEIKHTLPTIQMSFLLSDKSILWEQLQKSLGLYAPSLPWSSASPFPSTHLLHALFWGAGVAELQRVLAVSCNRYFQLYGQQIICLFKRKNMMACVTDLKQVQGQRETCWLQLTPTQMHLSPVQGRLAPRKLASAFMAGPPPGCFLLPFRVRSKEMGVGKWNFKNHKTSTLSYVILRSKL